MNNWINEWMIEWMNEWIDKWMNEWNRWIDRLKDSISLYAYRLTISICSAVQYITKFLLNLVIHTLYHE